MEVIEAVKKVIQEIVVPELDEIRSEYREIKGILDVTNSRLSDMNGHLIEQSRRIDDTNKRLDRLYEVIVRREEHAELKERLIRLENELHELKSKVAA